MTRPIEIDLALREITSAHKAATKAIAREGLSKEVFQELGSVIGFLSSAKAYIERHIDHSDIPVAEIPNVQPIFTSDKAKPPSQKMKEVALAGAVAAGFTENHEVTLTAMAAIASAHMDEADRLIRQAKCNFDITLETYKTHGESPGFLATDQSTYATGTCAWVYSSEQAAAAASHLEAFGRIFHAIDLRARQESADARREKISGGGR